MNAEISSFLWFTKIKITLKSGTTSKLQMRIQNLISVSNKGAVTVVKVPWISHAGVHGDSQTILEQIVRITNGQNIIGDVQILNSSSIAEWIGVNRIAFTN